MTPPQTSIRTAICKVGRRLYEHGHVVANDGNISVRLDGEQVLTTPTGVCKADLEPDMLVIVGMDGKPRSQGRPSSELPLHLHIYKNRPDARAVVHTHSPHASAFAVANVALDKCVLAEIVATLGSVPVAPFGTPSTSELPKSVEPYLQEHDAILLANHGLVTLGTSLEDAFFKVERVEHFAKISLLSRLIGGEQPLPKDKVQTLFGLRETYGLEGPNAGCRTTAPADEQASPPDETDLSALVARVVQRIRNE